MRLFPLVLTLLVLSLPLTAQAGSLSFTEGQGTWQSTKCTPPTAPGPLPSDPETAANDLNARIAAANAYADSSKAYMDCVSDEAQSDAGSVNRVISRSVQAVMQRTQADVAAVLSMAQKKAEAQSK